MHTAGGRVSITVNGVVYSARGEIKLSPSRISVDVGSNQDGSLFKTIKPKPVMAECTFDRFVDGQGNNLVWKDDLLLVNDLSANFVERDTGITHLLTKATFYGDPSLNLGQGEVDGLKIAAENYTSV